MIKYNSNLQDITLYLQHIMLDKGIKQKDIAERTGWSKQTVSNIFNGRTSNITLETLQTLCGALGCNLYIDVK